MLIRRTFYVFKYGISGGNSFILSTINQNKFVPIEKTAAYIAGRRVVEHYITV